ncbi:unnamed protein product [Angiostrongylus costaricensis]|uniref:Endo/exonuclease/phosphatase domain-containing protein n=1 Tax=Angiostrongylus costaricensis TaxID=334426 RepID=A0A0R3PMS0_ANGCS|nr:unnamed protein product [Angiostrongylus costaricensis]
MICASNARTLASEYSIEDLIDMQAGRVRYDVIGLGETRRRNPFNAIYDIGEELFLGTCDSRGVCGVGVLVNTSMSMNINSFEQLTTRIGRLRLKISGSIQTLTIFVVYASTSNDDEGRRSRSVLIGLGELQRRRPYIFTVIVGDSNAKTGSRDCPRKATLDHTD